MAEGEPLERYLTARVLVHSVAGDEYRSRMARLADEFDQDTIGEELRRITTCRPEALDVLRRAMPELPMPMLGAAVRLARYGATRRDLVRLLRLSPAQALLADLVAATTADDQD